MTIEMNDLMSEMKNYQFPIAAYWRFANHVELFDSSELHNRGNRRVRSKICELFSEDSNAKLRSAWS